MPAKDYIPTKESDIVLWVENFITVANANLSDLGLNATDITNLTSQKTDFATKLNNAVAKKAEAKAATESKNISKNELVSNIRVLARQIQARQGVSNNLKEQLGLNVPDLNPTPLYPFQPLDLSGNIGVGGVAIMKWNRNNNPQRTPFLIESSNNYDTGWHIIGTTTKTTYEAPLNYAIGQNYFRVRAQKGEFTSDPSNVIVL